MCQNNVVLSALHTTVLVEWMSVLLEYVDHLVTSLKALGFC